MYSQAINAEVASLKYLKLLEILTDLKGKENITKLKEIFEKNKHISKLFGDLQDLGDKCYKEINAPYLLELVIEEKEVWTKILEYLFDKNEESELFDFKLNFQFDINSKMKKKWAHVSAFANNSGGILIVGFDEKLKQVMNVKNPESFINNFHTEFNRNMFLDGINSTQIIKHNFIRVKYGKSVGCVVIIFIACTKNPLAMNSNGLPIYYDRLGMSTQKSNLTVIKKRKLDYEPYEKFGFVQFFLKLIQWNLA